jgi:5-methylcytosine-specific restriction enzyme subunit McrC
MIVLREYTDTEVALDDRDAQWLSERVGNAFVVRRSLGGMVVINPRQFVGVLTLPSGVSLTVQTKVPASNLFIMLAVAYRLPSPFREQAARYDTIDEVLEFLVDEFIHLVDTRIAAGLHRNYIEREDNLAAVRGRIAIAEDFRRNYILRQRVFCRFTEFSWDIPENQVIRQVAHLLTGWVSNPKRRLRLWQIDHLLAEVSPVQVPAALLDRFVYDRLNADYESIHHLCRLFLHGASVSEHAGETPFRSFLLDMNQLFEQFVTEVLRNRAPQGMEVSDQYRAHLDEDRRLAIRPDLLVSRHGRPALVADCKYKRLDDHEPFRHHDVYQALAYCTALGLDRGMLLYPQHEFPRSDNLAIRNRDVVIRHASIDLGGSPADLRAACDDLADAVFGWVAA